MIPFWKKTDKHSKPQSAQKRRQNAKPAVPRTAQQSIPMQRMFEDGTCRVKPNYYTRTIQYQDINYQLAQQEDKTAIFEEWCSFLNFFDSSIKFELSFVNMATDSTEFEKSIRIPFQKDGFDDVRAEYSQMLRQQLAKGNNGLTKTKFITFGVEGESMAQVKPRLDHIQNDLLNNFHRLGVQAKPLNGVQRLKLMHDMFNMRDLNLLNQAWPNAVFGLRPRLFFLLIPYIHIFVLHRRFYERERPYHLRASDLRGNGTDPGNDPFHPHALRCLPLQFCRIQSVQNRHCSQRRPEHGHLHSLPDAARLRLCSHAPLTQPYHHTLNEARCGTSGSGLCT